MKVSILGAGISGISCGYHLKEKKISSVIYEKDNEWGGLCGNFIIDGFRFDRFVHFTFTKDQYVRSVFEKSSKTISHKPEAKNYYNGVWLRHPVQSNLYPLKVEEKVDIIMDLINKENIKPSNYEEWLKSQYGECFSENFPMQYTKKYWTLPAAQLETKWVGERMDKTDLKDVLMGAMKEHSRIDYYTSEMRYPEKGGFKSIINEVSAGLDIRLSNRVCEIDTVSQTIGFSDGSQENYDCLVSSLPLTSLVNIVKGIPQHIKDESKKLLCTSGYIVSLGFNRADIPKDLWFYIYDQEILASRVYSPSMKSKDNVPSGCSSLQAEVYFSREHSIDMSIEDILDHVIADLIKMGLFKMKDLVVKDIRMKVEKLSETF